MSNQSGNDSYAIFQKMLQTEFFRGFSGIVRLRLAWPSLSIEQKYTVLTNSRSHSSGYDLDLLFEIAGKDESDFIRYVARRELYPFVDRQPSDFDVFKAGDHSGMLTYLEDEENSLTKDQFFELSSLEQLLSASSPVGFKLLVEQALLTDLLTLYKDSFPRRQAINLLHESGRFCRLRIAQAAEESGSHWRKPWNWNDHDPMEGVVELWRKFPSLEPDDRKLMLLEMPAVGGEQEDWNNILQEVSVEERQSLLPLRWQNFGADQLYQALFRVDRELLDHAFSGESAYACDDSLPIMPISKINELFYPRPEQALPGTTPLKEDLAIALAIGPSISSTKGEEPLELWHLAAYSEAYERLNGPERSVANRLGLSDADKDLLNIFKSGSHEERTLDTYCDYAVFMACLASDHLYPLIADAEWHQCALNFCTEIGVREFGDKSVAKTRALIERKLSKAGHEQARDRRRQMGKIYKDWKQGLLPPALQDSPYPTSKPTTQQVAKFSFQRSIKDNFWVVFWSALFLILILVY